MSETMRILHSLEWEDGWNKTNEYIIFHWLTIKHASWAWWGLHALQAVLWSTLTQQQWQKRSGGSLLVTIFDRVCLTSMNYSPSLFGCQAGMNLNLILGKYHISMINGIMLWSASAAASSRFIPPRHASPCWKCWLILPRNKCECRIQTCPLKILGLFLYIGNNTKKRKKMTNKKTVCFEIWMNKLQ